MVVMMGDDGGDGDVECDCEGCGVRDVVEDG